MILRVRDETLMQDWVVTICFLVKATAHLVWEMMDDDTVKVK
jgi:hypothetical protein